MNEPRTTDTEQIRNLNLVALYGMQLCIDRSHPDTGRADADAIVVRLWEALKPCGITVENAQLRARVDDWIAKISKPAKDKPQASAWSAGKNMKPAEPEGVGREALDEIDRVQAREIGTEPAGMTTAHFDSGKEVDADAAIASYRKHAAEPAGVPPGWPRQVPIDAQEWTDALATHVAAVELHKLRGVYEELQEVGKELNETEAENVKLREYVRHRIDCEVGNDLDLCTCGLNDLLKVE